MRSEDLHIPQSISASTPPSKLSRASQQALAIMAVDNLQISPATLALMHAIDAGTMTHDEAIQSILKRAAEYAQRKT